MSFILESIKQAERERKLGQQAPSISIEYSGAHVENIENNKMRWLLLSVALCATAMVVWSATYYFANKDRQYMEQYAEELALNNVNSLEEPSLQGSISAEKSFNKVASNPSGDAEKRDVLMVPVKNVHKSDLKSVKLISADEEVPKTKIEKVVEVKKSVTNKVSRKKATSEIKPAIEPAIKKAQTKLATATVADKQELAEIYSDLSKLEKQDTVVNEPKFIEQQAFEQNDLQKHIADELVQIEKANYVAPKHAVSTGVPSFGELPYEIQEKIPDFNVSVHMFHADPNQRRIRINGNMYTEGKNLQQNLALVEITRYGAVFDYQGHKFRLNVR